jgi:hypothetical protein
MGSATVSRTHVDPVSDAARLDDLIPIFGGGMVIGGMAVVLCALVDAAAIGIYADIAGDAPASWPSGVVIAIGVIAVLASAWTGRCLLRVRRWIGQTGGPMGFDNARSRRRRFILGALAVYLPLTPVVWLLAVSIANTAT